MFDIESIKNLEDTQKSNFYRAKVISLDDPLKLNRIQVMIYGLTDDFETPDNVEDSPQPWCEFQFRDGVITYPNEDDIIWLFFEGGDIFRPVYLGTVYAGLDGECEDGWNKFLAERPIAVNDPGTFKTNIKNINNMIDPDSKLIITDVHQTFNNFILLEDNPHSVEFTGKNEAITETTDIITGGKTVAYTVENLSVHPDYRRFPKTFDTMPKKMYMWYYTEDKADWKTTLGGWTFYTEKQIQEALAVFPDNLKHINYRRYQNWANMIDNAYERRQPQPPTTVKKRPISWEFIPMPPCFYWNPEMMEEDSIIYKLSHSFPFGKMNVKNRKYWKQHTILSHDGKSAIELDDNDEYERLRIDFNYGAGGLEFSRVGFNGAELWTDGVFNFYADGNTNEDSDKVSRFTVNKCDLLFRGGRSIDMNAQRNFGIFGGNDVSIAAKRGTFGVMAGDGIIFGSTEGTFINKGNVSDSNAFSGTPIITATSAGAGNASMAGSFLFLKSPEIGFEAACQWVDKFNMALMAIKQIAKAIRSDAFSITSVAKAPHLASAGTAAANILDSWDINTKVASIVYLATAWDKIQMQGSS